MLLQQSLLLLPHDLLLPLINVLLSPLLLLRSLSLLSVEIELLLPQSLDLGSAAKRIRRPNGGK